MFSLIRTSVKLVLLFLLSLAALSCFAGNGITKPSAKAVFQHNQIKKLDSFMNGQAGVIFAQPASAVSKIESDNSADRICSCQILNLESANYDHRYVVLLAEKTNDGTSSVYKTAKSRIQKEKKQLKKLFYDKVKVVAEVEGAGTCKSMFYKLSSADSNLRLYEILNADVQ